LLTAKVIFLSKYFSKAKENKNNEKIDISIDGISVNKEKKIIYFLFEIEPLTLIFFFNEFLVSINIIKKKKINKIISANNKYFKFSFVAGIKLFSIKVKNVIKLSVNVIKKIITIKIFLFIKDNMI
tara:strand:+ start:1893 stop:2270 length:378 start_codon:yes stop_codon:yes gene_type:complete